LFKSEVSAPPCIVVADDLTPPAKMIVLLRQLALVPAATRFLRPSNAAMAVLLAVWVAPRVGALSNSGVVADLAAVPRPVVWPKIIAVDDNGQVVFDDLEDGASSDISYSFAFAKQTLMNPSCAAAFPLRINSDSNCSQTPAWTPTDFPEREFLSVFKMENATLKVFNAGLGATGTHAFHQEMCAAGFKSLHWAQSCNDVPQDAIDAHSKLFELWGMIRKCAKGDLDPKSHLCEAHRLAHGIRHNIRKVVTSGVEAISDAPYTHFAPFVLKLVPDVRVVQTLRSPTIYAQKWTHFQRHDPICLHPAVSGGQSHWDFFGCLQNATYVSDALINIDTFVEKRQQTALFSDKVFEAIGTYAVQHNNFIKQLTKPDLFCELCAWDDNFQTTIDDMASSLMTAFDRSNCSAGNPM